MDCADESAGDPGLAGTPPSVGVPLASGATVSTESASIPLSDVFSFREEHAAKSPAANAMATSLDENFMFSRVK